MSGRPPDPGDPAPRRRNPFSDRPPIWQPPEPPVDGGTDLPRRGRAALNLFAAFALVVAVYIGGLTTGSAAFGIGVPDWVVILVVVPATMILLSRAAAAVSNRRSATTVAPRPARAAELAPERTWPQARERFEHLQREYAGFECDPLQVLRLPALTDIAVPSTSRFIDAFAAAQTLLTDRDPGPQRAPTFIAAVESAERAWAAARDTAQRIRLQGIDPAERAAVERVVKLLTTARDSDSGPERHLAYARARAELNRLDAAGVIHVPLPTRAALDAAARGELSG